MRHLMSPLDFTTEELDKLFDLADVGGVGKTAGTAGVSQRDCHVVFFADIKDLIIIFVERIFFACHAHPGKDQTSSPADDIHFSFVFADLVDGLSCDTAVEGDEVNAVLRMKADNVDEILRGQ